MSLPGGTNAVATTTTSEDGSFAFTAVRPEFYVLNVEASGFAKYTARGIKVDPSVDTTVPSIKLEVQQIQQSVEVSATAQTVQTANNEITSTLTQTQMRNLPVLNRQVSALFQTQAGVNSGRTVTTINGLRSTYANLTLDGINVQDNFIRTNGLDYIPSRFTINQVAEFTVQGSNASAASPGTVQIVQVTPSGTNQYHGDVYWYNRNSYFAANNWFSNRDGVARPQLNQNQLGASFSGPLIKDKLLFYGNYEAFRLNQQTARNRTILTPSARQGLLTYRTNTGATQTINVLTAKNLTADQEVASILSQMPAQGNNTRLGDGLNTTGYSFNQRNNTSRNAVTGKADYYLTQKHSFSGTYVWNTDVIDRGDLGTGFEITPPIQNEVQNNLLSSSWRWTPTPTLTNEVRGGFLRAKVPFNVSYDFPSYLVNAPGGTFYSNPQNQYQGEGRDTNTYSLQDNANWVKGRHSVAFGWQSQWIRIRSYNNAFVLPTYQLGFSPGDLRGFTPSELPGIISQDLTTANNLLATVGGLINGYRQQFNVTARDSGFVPGASQIRRYSNDNHAFYVQDNWRVAKNFTLNLGLRYEYYVPLDDRDGLQLLPVIPNGSNYVDALRANHTLDFAGGDSGRKLYNPDRNNFGPRFGFAWDVFGNGKTAIRGGYSITYANEELLSIFSTLNDNFGLQLDLQNTNAPGLLRSRPNIPTPAFQVPRTAADNFVATNANNVGASIDPGLRTPYIQQFSFGVQQELAGNILEVRYVGNKGTKLWRSIDFNQIDPTQGGFLPDFIRARNNAFLAQAAGSGFNPNYNPNIPGSQPLTVFPTLPSNGGLNSAANLAVLQTGEAGTYAQNLMQARQNGNINFFPNPLALRLRGVTNYSNSTYHSLQVDLRRRMRNGLELQANYVWSKNLSDSIGNGADRFEEFLDYNTPSIEKAPTLFDVRHAFKTNAYYELPFGKGRKYDIGAWHWIAGGWGLASSITWQSGNPFSVLSARGTVNRGARSGQNTAVTLLDQEGLDDVVGFFMTGNGPYVINPANINAQGRGVAGDGQAPFPGQVFFNPGAGQLGTLQRRMFTGPSFFNLDAAIQKTFQFTERHSLEFRAEAFNLPNTPQFSVGGDYNINSTTFGRLTAVQNASRRLQFGLYYRF